MIKVSFFEPDAFGGSRTENMWASRIGETYILENSPIFKYGVSYKDTFSVKVLDGTIYFDKIIEHSGHSTYRLMLREESMYMSPGWMEPWTPIEELGCFFEGDASNQMFSVDIPPLIDVDQVLRLMNAAEDMGFWYFEEGHRY